MLFSILSWNIQGQHPIVKTRFKRIIPELEKKTADVICLQEARAAKHKLEHISGIQDYAKVFRTTGFNHNVILSRHPILAHGDFAFKGFRRQLESAIWADIDVGRRVRIYNCHFAIFGVGPATRVEQLKQILDHADTHDGPTVICGDLNTVGRKRGIGRAILRTFHRSPPGSYIIEGEDLSIDERYTLVKVAEDRGFREALDLEQTTWRMPHMPWEPFKMKLDWMLVREIATPEVNLLPYITDHRAIHASCMAS